MSSAITYADQPESGKQGPGYAGRNRNSLEPGDVALERRKTIPVLGEPRLCRHGPGSNAANCLTEDGEAESSGVLLSRRLFTVDDLDGCGCLLVDWT
ncbi:MAG: hypothetical protein JO037_04850 [Actinobacteria bacterium]|nr:hypothetical protein [Actinomycetota bacterium]